MAEVASSGKILDLDILRKVFVYVKPYKGLFAVLVMLTLVSGVVTGARPYIIQQTIDHYILKGDTYGLWGMSLLLLVFVFAQAILDYTNAYLSGWMGQHIIKDIRLKLYAHLIRLRLSFYDKTPIGRLITRNISDIETISDIFTEGLADIAGTLIMLACFLVFMFYMSWKLTLISLSVVPLLFLSTFIFKEKVKSSFNDVRTAVANLNTFLQEHITGMNIVQIFNTEHRELHKFKDINKQHRQANLKSVLYYSIYFPVAEVLAAAGIGLLIWWGSIGVFRSEFTLGDLTAFILYISMFFRPIREIADKFNTLQMGIVGSSRVMQMLEDEEYVPAQGRNLTPPIRGRVEFRHIHFGYHPDKSVLKDLSFVAEEGKVTAFVGATGAGKSSIIGLMNRFYEYDMGEILLDQVPLRDIELSHLRAHIGMVLQDVFLFSESIEYNISLGNPAISREQIIQASKAVGAHSFIMNLPGNYDYKVMERGATLSVGQRQLLSFVRAMVYNPRILILDEATSSIDSDTESLIQQALQKLLHGRTSIVIAHRLSTIKHADCIHVIDQGQILESGTHESLISHNGRYAELCKVQFAAEFV